MDYKIELDNKSGILLFTITREDKRNAINYEVMDGLGKAMDRALQEDVRVLAITGAGDKAFCSGGDLTAFHSLHTEQEAYGMLSQMGELLYKLAVFPKPTVAIINGTAVGGGCELAAACDYRIARTGAKIGFIQGGLSITTGWGGGTLLFERIENRFAFKMLSEAAVFQAEQLNEFGFIDRLHDKVGAEEVRAFFANEQLIDSNVLQAYKQMMIGKWQEGGLKSRMDKEIHTCAVLWAKDEHHQAVAAFLSKDT
jgi:enoyl-CoA hydratase/carnithine racemase